MSVSTTNTHSTVPQSQKVLISRSPKINSALNHSYHKVKQLTTINSNENIDNDNNDSGNLSNQINDNGNSNNNNIPVPPISVEPKKKRAIPSIISKQNTAGIILSTSKVLSNNKTIFYFSVGKGNNGALVRNVFLSRPWWNDCTNEPEKSPNVRWQQLTPSSAKFLRVYQANGVVQTGGESVMVYNHLPQNILLHSKVSLWELMSYKLKSLGYNIFDMLPVTYLYSNPIGCAKMQIHFKYLEAKFATKKEGFNSSKSATNIRSLPLPLASTVSIAENKKNSSEAPEVNLIHIHNNSSNNNEIIEKEKDNSNIGNNDNILMPPLTNIILTSSSTAVEDKHDKAKLLPTLPPENSNENYCYTRTRFTNKPGIHKLMSNKNNIENSSIRSMVTYKSIPVMSVRSQDVSLMSVKTMKKYTTFIEDENQQNFDNPNNVKQKEPPPVSIVYSTFNRRSCSNPANFYKYRIQSTVKNVQNKRVSSNGNSNIDKVSSLSKKVGNDIIIDKLHLSTKDEQYLNQISREIAATKNDITNMWIVKPSGLNRGRGVRVVSSIEELETHIRVCKKQETLDFDSNKEKNSSGGKEEFNCGSTGEDTSDPEVNNVTDSQNSSKHQLLIKNMASTAVHGVTDVSCCGMQFLVQKYLETPLLIDKRKFDIRCYGLATWNGECYYYRDGYLRTSTKEYTLDTLDARVHLTNNAVQKDLDGYATYEDGNMRDYDFLNEYINGIEKRKAEELGTEPKLNIFYDRIWPQMQNLITIAMEVAGSKMAVINDSSSNTSMDASGSFELFGFDFMITDENNGYKPILIEVNSNPCLSLSSNTSWSILPRMLDDLLEITVDKFFGIPKNYVEQLQKRISSYKDQINNKFTSVTNLEKNEDFIINEKYIIEKNNIGLHGRRGKPENYVLENGVNVKTRIPNSIADMIAIGGSTKGLFLDGLRWACLLDPNYPVICRKNRWVKCLSRWQNLKNTQNK